MVLFDVNAVAFVLWGQAVSYVELTGTLFGFVSVYLASRGHLGTWATGIVNELFLFCLFFQVQLYADMLLQLFFFIATLYGWYFWKKHPGEAGMSLLSATGRIAWTAGITVGTLAAGWLIARLHVFLPGLFALPADFAFIDSFILVASIAATILLAAKRFENWLLWIAIDVVATALYFYKGMYFLSLEYLLFTGLAAYGWLNWRREMAQSA